MDIQTKKHIDSLWVNSYIGEFVECYFKNDEKRAEEIKQELFDAGYFLGMEQYSVELGEKIIEIVGNIDGWDEYLEEIDKENPEMWEALYYTRVFSGFESEMMYGKWAKSKN